MHAHAFVEKPAAQPDVRLRGRSILDVGPIHAFKIGSKLVSSRLQVRQIRGASAQPVQGNNLIQGDGDLAAVQRLPRENAAIRDARCKCQASAALQNQSAMNAFGMKRTKQLAVEGDDGNLWER